MRREGGEWMYLGLLVSSSAGQNQSGGLYSAGEDAGVSSCHRSPGPQTQMSVREVTKARGVVNSHTHTHTFVSSLFGQFDVF